MENRTQHPESRTRTFLRGFTSSAANGVLMSGIFYGLGFAAQGLGLLGTKVAFTLASAATGGALLVAAVAVFGGVMALKHAGGQTRAGHAHSPAARGHGRGHSHEIAPVMMPVMGVAADEAPAQGGWVERTGGSASRTRVQDILNNGSMSDRDRASAILAARETAATQAQTR